jgi:hypothetical protein
MAERNQRAAARQASLRVGSKKAAPMPSAEQQEYMYMNQQARNPSLASIQTIVRAVQQNKKQTGE